MLRKVGGDDRIGSAVDVVFDPMEGRAPRSVSSSSQAARGSPSRGWPTLPGLISQRPRPRSSVVPRPPGRRARPGVPAGDLGGECEEQGDVGMTHEGHPARLRPDALGCLVGPEHVLPDGIARGSVVEATSRLSSAGSSVERKSTAVGSMRSRVQRTAAAAAGEKVEMSSCSSTARSWLPTRQVEQLSLTRAVHSFGWAP